MLRRDSFFGSIVAIITPFTSSGRIDRKALEALIEWHIQEKTDGIVCGGTTGEGFSLSRAEKKSVTEICVKVAAGRIPIIAGTGACSTRETILYTEDALKLGASASLIVTPYYNRPTQKGCLEHFRQVATVGQALIVYHNPARAVFRFVKETLHDLIEIPEVIALKDSGRDFSLIEGLYSRLPILAGDDDLTGEIIEKGGKGAISVIGNILPRQWSSAIHLALAKDPKAKELFQHFMPLCRANFLETNPQCVKYLVSEMKRCKPVFRSPLYLPAPEIQQTLKQTLLEVLKFDA